LIRSVVERVAPNALEPVGGNRFHLRVVLAAFMVAFAVAASAQTPKPPELSLRFSVFSAKPIEGLTYVPRANAAPAKLVFYPTARSPRGEYRGANPIRFLDASGAVVAEATVPPEIHDALLLVSAIEPAPASGLKYRVAVLDDGAAQHTAGGLAVVNLSGLALSGTIDGKPATLKDGLNPTLSVGRTAKIALHTTLKGRTYQAYAENLTLKKNERALLILFPPFYKGSLEVQSRMLVDEPPAVTVPR
jgi:hypothetical protein